jgi:hypothetical protein
MKKGRVPAAATVAQAATVQQTFVAVGTTFLGLATVRFLFVFVRRRRSSSLGTLHGDKEEPQEQAQGQKVPVI